MYLTSPGLFSDFSRRLSDMSVKRKREDSPRRSPGHIKTKMIIDLFQQSHPQSPQLSNLPTEIILLIADHLGPRDLFHFASVSWRNWLILQRDCHQMAFRVAYPSPHGRPTPRSWFLDAVSKGNFDAVWSFLNHGVNPNLSDTSGLRALHLAAHCRWPLNMSNLLLFFGANPSLPAVDKPFVTPLYTAVIMGNQLLACLLMDKGADMHQGHIIHTISRYCEVELLNHAIDSGANIYEINGGGNNLLHSAAKNKSRLVVPYLLRHGLKDHVNALNASGKTPLLEAIANQKQDNAWTLLLYGANPNILYPTGISALQMACYLKQEIAVRVMIDVGADVEFEGPDGRRALHYAAAASANLTYTVLAGGADVTAIDSLGNTALHIACIQNDLDSDGFESAIEIVKLLVSWHAPVDVENNDGHTPIDIAIFQGQIKWAEVMTKNGSRLYNKKRPLSSH